ncbi:MAG: guanylate kinase, partial [Acetivibrio ethanolgignens]
TGETEGIEYRFVSWERFKELEKEGRVIEFRIYHTVLGDWSYFTVADGQIDLEHQDYLMLNTLEGYEKTCRYYGKDKVVPIYIEVEDGLRLSRALEREKQQAEPKYAEMCRRYLADEEDFSSEKLLAAGIEKKYQNLDLEECLCQIINDIQK